MATQPTPIVAPQQFLQPYETDILRTLLVARQQANDNVRSYLLQILGQRGLDINKYGISPDLHSFVEILVPSDPAPDPVPDTPAIEVSAPAGS